MKNLASIVIILSVLLGACKTDNYDGSDVLVTAYGNKLYQSDLGDYLSENMSAADSQSVIKKHVDTWLMEEMLLNEAKDKVSNKRQINRLVESYEKSLYIHELEKIKMGEILDTSISSAAVDTFYSRHSNEFVLDDAISKLLFIKVPESLDNEELKTLWTTENIPALKVYVKNGGGLQLLDLDKWYYLSYIKNLSPKALIDKISFDKKASYSLQEDGYKYLVRILDYVKADEVAPKSFVAEKIKLRMFHDNSTDLLKKYKKELYQNNIQSKNITIH